MLRCASPKESYTIYRHYLCRRCVHLARQCAIGRFVEMQVMNERKLFHRRRCERRSGPEWGGRRCSLSGELSRAAAGLLLAPEDDDDDNVHSSQNYRRDESEIVLMHATLTRGAALGRRERFVCKLKVGNLHGSCCHDSINTEPARRFSCARRAHNAQSAHRYHAVPNLPIAIMQSAPHDQRKGTSPVP